MKIFLNLDESMRMFVNDGPEDEDHEYNPRVDVPEELLERHRKAALEFETVDEELYQIYLKAQKEIRKKKGLPQ